MSNYDTDEVRKAAEGKWLYVLSVLSDGRLDQAIEKVGRHVPCPVHGGVDGFRLFKKDADLTGGGVCNTCGAKTNGFDLLMWVNGWNFSQTVDAVGEYLGVEKGSWTLPQTTAATKAKPTSKRNQSYYGNLVLHGPAPFDNKPDNEDSYFVILRYQNGAEHKFWGVGLQCALEESGAQENDVIEMTCTGKEAVVVPCKGDDGQMIYKQTLRNVWKIKVRGEKNTESRSQDVASGEEVSSQGKSSTEETPRQGKEMPHTSFHRDPKLDEIQKRLELQRKRNEANAERHLGNILRVWNESLPFTSRVTGPLRRYFQNRGLIFNEHEVERSDSLRFCPSLAYFEEVEEVNEKGEKSVRTKETGNFPAIVCALRDAQGELVTLQRTYLSPDGEKAKVKEPKKMMSIPQGLDIKGCAVRLGNPSQGILGVAEGLETALAAYRVSKIPVWATVNAEFLKGFSPPEGVHTILVWADKDRSLTGEKAAYSLKTRLEELGLTVYILLPKSPIPEGAKGIDWNDVLMNEGIIGFPDARNLQRVIRRNVA